MRRPSHRIDYSPTPERRRGSVLVVALLAAALIALVLGGYLSLNLGAARLSQRTFNRGAAFHLAEAGLEEGLWTYNRLLAGNTDAWNDWSVSDGAAWRRFDGFTFATATTGAVKVYASPITPDDRAQPSLVALASVQSPGAAPVTQLLEVTLRRRSLFTSGLVARDGLAFRGRNTVFDAWDSDPDQNPATPAIPYSSAVARDTAELATGAEQDSDLDLGQARIFGYFRTAGLRATVRGSGLIGPFGTADGVIDASRVAADYQEGSFPIVTPPADGVFLPSFGATLGVAGQKTSWRAAALRLNGNQVLTICGDVTLVLTDPLDALAITGNACLVVPAGSSLTLYLSGDALVAGRGAANGNAAPAALQFWSTADGSRRQRFQISGGGGLSALVYAPEGEFTATGNGEFAGSVVARTIVFGGNAVYHYDLSLGRLSRHAPYGARGWRTVDDPATRATLLRLVDR